MSYQITIPDISDSCVIKLWYAGKYVISKCRTLVRLKENIEGGVGRFLKNTPKGRREDDLYYEMYCHVLENPEQDFYIEILCSSNNPLELLKAEHMALLIARSDPRCLNNDFQPYIPRFTQINGKKSWINRGYYLNYMSWKKKFANRQMLE